MSENRQFNDLGVRETGGGKNKLKLWALQSTQPSICSEAVESVRWVGWTSFKGFG